MLRGDTVEVDLPQNAGPGREQVGRRPALIIHNNDSLNTSPVVMIVPFTSNLGALRFPHVIQVNPSARNGLRLPSVAMVFQLRAIDRKRIMRSIGRLEDPTLRQIEHQAKDLIGL